MSHCRHFGQRGLRQLAITCLLILRALNQKRTLLHGSGNVLIGADKRAE